MFYSCDQSPVTVEVNTLVSKRSELIGNAAIVRKRCEFHKKSTCVCLRHPVAANYAEAQERKFDLWPALENFVDFTLYKTNSLLLNGH